MRKRHVLVLLVLLLLAATAWSGGQKGEQIVIEMWKGPHTDHDQDAFQEVITDFEAANPGVKVKYVPTPWETIS